MSPTIIRTSEKKEDFGEIKLVGVKKNDLKCHCSHSHEKSPKTLRRKPNPFLDIDLK